MQAITTLRGCCAGAGAGIVLICEVRLCCSPAAAERGRDWRAGCDLPAKGQRGLLTVLRCRGVLRCSCEVAVLARCAAALRLR